MIGVRFHRIGGQGAMVAKKIRHCKEAFDAAVYENNQNC